MAENNDESKQSKPWRKAVRTAMRNAARREAKQRYGTEDPSFNYRWEHVKAVVTLALRLAELTGVDLDVIEAAAWLHDIRKDKKDKHPQAGARYARKLLRRTTFPPDKIEAVATAIEEHMGLWRDEPLTAPASQVLWDADKLAKIGLTAVFHWTGMRLANGRSLKTRDFLESAQNKAWQVKTVASMHSEPARQAAQQRLAAYNAVWEQLANELEGNDLV